MDWLSDLLERFVTDAADLASGRRQIAAIATGGAAGATAFLEACRLVGEAATDSAGLIAALDDVDEPSVYERVGMLVIAAFAALRADYPARPDARRAREGLAARAETVIDAAGEAFGPELHDWLTTLVGTALVQISQIAATRAPLVRVDTGLSLPATLIAWDLYGDPARDAELVDRNDTGTAMVMPVSLEALAP